jgi:hypothetical protein
MSLTVSGVTNSKTYETCPEGTFAARCYQIIDLGHQTMVWEGQASVKPIVRITWEISEKMADGRPFVISKEYTARITPKSSLKKDLEAWRGRAFTDQELANFSLENVLGKPCLIQVSQTKKGDKSYSNVTSIMSLPKGMPCEELVNPAVTFDINDFNKEVFESLPEFVRKKILMSKEMEERQVPVNEPEPAPEIDSDEIPF